MIQQRDYTISLEQQIENIRKTIEVDNKDEYPIDIMDGFNQIYIEKLDGYWERYEYDAEGKLLSYVDSTDPENPRPIRATRKRNPTLDNIHLLKLPILHLSNEEKMEAVRSILQKENKEGVIIRDGGLRRGITIDPAMMGCIGLTHHFDFDLDRDSHRWAEKVSCVMETKVFMVEMNDTTIEDEIDYMSCNDVEFMNEARRQSHGGQRVFTLSQFQESCNKGKTSIVSGIIRFIEMAKVVTKDVSGSMK